MNFLTLLQGVDEGIVKGLYKFSDAKPADHKAQRRGVIAGCKFDLV